MRPAVSNKKEGCSGHPAGSHVRNVADLGARLSTEPFPTSPSSVRLLPFSRLGQGMAKKSSKSRSKRVTLHQKYKVLKKIKEHHKKKAKELRKKGGRVKPPKDPGIPNSWPFKEQLVKELEFERARVEAAKLARKEAAKECRVRGSGRRLARAARSRCALRPG